MNVWVGVWEGVWEAGPGAVPRASLVCVLASRPSSTGAGHARKSEGPYAGDGASIGDGIVPSNLSRIK